MNYELFFRLANAVGHASGGLFSQNHFWQHKQTRRLARYSTRLISDLQAKYGFSASLDCGRLLLAQSLPTFLSFQRLQTIAS